MSQVFGANQRDHQIDQQRRRNDGTQHINPRHRLRSSAAQPATSPNVSSRNTAITAMNNQSTSILQTILKQIAKPAQASAATTKTGQRSRCGV